MPMLFPSNPAGQTPVNTYSPTSLPVQNTFNGFTYTWNSALGVWEGTAPAGSSLLPATLAEAAAGTINTKYSSPETAVPKNAAGMTGAAIIPSGTDAQRAAITPLVTGMQRYNTDSGYEEVYTGVTLGWQKLAWNITPVLPDVTLSGATSLASSYYCRDFTVSAGATLTSSSQGVYVRATRNVVINASTWTLVGVAGAPFNIAATVLGSSGFGLGAGLPGAGSGLTGKPYYVIAQLGGSSGASGTHNTGFNAANQAGGAAGGYIVIIADGDVTLNGAVTMNCAGANGGTVGTPIGGGGGGGSGGCIILSSTKTLTTPGSVTFNVSGGAGSNGITGAFPGGGGGGGGGGWVILQAANLVDASTKNLAGGAAGVDSGGGAITGGGGGGSYAGAGGGGGFTSVPPVAGSPGVFALGYVPV